MRIVNRKEFLAMPAGTVYWKYEPGFFRDLGRKGDSIAPPKGAGIDGKPHSGDFYTTGIVDCIHAKDSDELFDKMEQMEKGAAEPCVYDSEMRDALYEEDDLLFVVLDAADVETMCRFLRGEDLK